MSTEQVARRRVAIVLARYDASRAALGELMRPPSPPPACWIRMR
jgi:hypothetical protein